VTVKKNQEANFQILISKFQTNSKSKMSKVQKSLSLGHSQTGRGFLIGGDISEKRNF
jgi:hypothetical protein